MSEVFLDSDMVYYNTIFMILFRINTESGIALYQQLIAQVEQGIASGKLQPGEKMPSMRELSLQLKINHLTVKQAYNALEVSGLMQTRRGLGTFITEGDAGTLIERKREELQQQLAHTVELAQSLGMSEEEFKKIIEWG